MRWTRRVLKRKPSWEHISSVNKASLLLYVSKHWLLDGHHPFPSRIRQACRFKALEHHSALFVDSTRCWVRNWKPIFSSGCNYFAGVAKRVPPVHPESVHTDKNPSGHHWLPELKLAGVLITAMWSAIQKQKQPTGPTSGDWLIEARQRHLSPSSTPPLKSRLGKYVCWHGKMLIDLLQSI